MTQTTKLDLTKFYKPDYSAPKEPKLLRIGKGHYFAIEGQGAPGSSDYQDRIGALYASAYTAKFASKAEGRDFVVCKLESLYWLPGSESRDFSKVPKQDWHWRLLIRMPEFITQRDLHSAIETIQSKGETPALEDLELYSLEEGDCIQMLHLGPYEEEDRTLAAMAEHAASLSLTPHGLHHEIYLSDPRRVEPARLKTILRMPVTSEERKSKARLPAPS